ncbi:MAG: ABC transporter ATP-binding protein [Candidatus Bathyarchaeia archaeon]
MSLLEVKRVSKRFGGLWALRDVGLDARSDEILGIIGPNGAGKTTLFNVIVGFYKPDAGSVVFEGEEITGFPPYKVCERGIARTFQLTRPFKELTILENVIAGTILRSKTYEEAEQKAMKVLEFTGLSQKKNIVAKSLTLLEHKRLELAKAVATEPKLLLLDEVVAGLKPAEMEDVLSMVKEIHKKGVGVVIVEHVMKAIMETCDRIIVLNYGEKIAEGEPKEIARNKAVIKAYLGEEYVTT